MLRQAWHRRRITPPELRRGYRMRGRRWLGHLYGELMERESHWMGVRALKNPLGCLGLPGDPARGQADSSGGAR